VEEEEVERLKFAEGSNEYRKSLHRIELVDVQMKRIDVALEGVRDAVEI